MSHKICVITGTRAEYGLLRWLMAEIEADSELTLQIIATGMHLSAKFGLTYREIENDGFRINRKIEILGNTDRNTDVSNAIANSIIGCADAFQELQPDLVILLGDRFEIFAAATAAHVANIPIAHIHGGELTEGSIDEAFRHSITKMSHLHFVAASEYRDRVIQLGENPDMVFLVGGLGVDSIKKITLLDRESLESSLGLKLSSRNLLVTFHPDTLENRTSALQMAELLDALSKLVDTTLIFTMPNADAGGLELIEMIEEFVKNHVNSHSFTSMGQHRYLSCIAQVDGVVGNSSSGLTEVPTFNVGTINIGDRQKGRLKAASVIDCQPSSQDITRALSILYSKEFQRILSNIENPYGEGGANRRILEVIRKTDVSMLLKKQFYNLENSKIKPDLSRIDVSN
jgi:GDP/UDP-N,N'-diacetylbacillosamine 2-epimerase (hydrolysing)